MKQLIEEQKRQFDILTNEEGADPILLLLKKGFWDWHTQSLKQLIDGLIDGKEKQKYQKPLLGIPEYTRLQILALNYLIDEDIVLFKSIRSQIE